MADLVFPGATGQMLNQAALPKNADLIIYKGDYLEVLVNIKDAAGAAVVLTGGVPAAHLKSDYNDLMPKAMTCELTGVPGQVKISMPSTATSELIPGSYIWDFQVTFSGGRTRTYLAGDVTVMNEVTIV